MNRDRRVARTASLIAFGAVFLLVASEATASEGDLVLLPDPRTLIILVVLFGLMVFPVNALIFKPIFRVLDERDEKIAGSRRHAERIFAQADEVLESYEQSLREVRQDAERGRKRTLERARADGAGRTAEARSETEREVARAREEVAVALSEARVTMRSQAQGLAAEVAARALGRAVS
jgi:F-type H+-transporting ATPase subunit b